MSKRTYQSGIQKRIQKIDYHWLCYSPTLNCCYCHSCWLFADRLKSHQFELIEGVSDWGHLSQKINRHKDSTAHLKAIISEKLWLDERGCIDKELEKKLFEQSNYWFSILQRLVDIIFIIASCKFAFRAHRKK